METMGNGEDNLRFNVQVISTWERRQDNMLETLKNFNMFKSSRGCIATLHNNIQKVHKHSLNVECFNTSNHTQIMFFLNVKSILGVFIY